MEYFYFIVGLIVSVILLPIEYSYSFGVLLALAALFLMKIFREAFNKRIMTAEDFGAMMFVRYMMVTFILMFSALGIAFLYPNLINPYFLAGTIFLERIYMFISKTIYADREELNV